MADHARLVTIGVSHYCEKARWGLEWAGVGFVEEAHAPGMHFLATRRAGGRSAPVLVWDGRTLTDSTDILRAADAKAASGRRLYPENEAERREVDALEEDFDEKLGPAVRRVIYHLLFARRDQALPVMGGGAPRGERAALAIVYPLLRAGMRRAMKIDDLGAERSRQVIDRVFEDVAQRLEGGRRYLVGDRFTAADLTLAALAAPAVLPADYGVPLPRLDQASPAIQDFVTRHRATPAGQHALRMYREHRRAR
jgi:glutathione S-transferase